MTDLTFGEDDIAAWRADGVICLRGAFDQSWIELLRAGFDQSMADPGPLSKDYAAGKGGSFFTDHDMVQRIEAFRSFAYDSPAAEIAACLMGSRKINLYDDHLLLKEPGTDNPTYWHHDVPYYQVKGDQFCSLWVPLDAVTAQSGAMRFVKGSHLWGKLFYPIRIGVGDVVGAADELDGPAPDIDAEPDKYDIVQYDLAPGDCIAFHGATLHAAGGNLSDDTRRRALALRFAGDDITWYPRPFAPSDHDTEGLVEGGPIDCEQYPVVWRG